MNRDRFSGFARWLATPGSRRGVLLNALGGVLLGEASEAEARHHKGKGKHKKGKHKKAACLHRGKVWCGGRCRTPRWTPRTTFGSEGSGDSQFSFPAGVAVANDGQTIWVADTENDRISVWTKAGGAWTHVGNFGSTGNGDSQFTYPDGVAVAHDGQTIWVADAENSRISVWTKVGGAWTPQSKFGGYGNGDSQFIYPGSVAVAEDEKTVWVADTGNHRISVWSKSGSAWTHAGSFGSEGSGASQFDVPFGVAVANDGQTVWVADTYNHRISVWTKAGGAWTHQVNFGSRGSGAAQFEYPGSVAVAGNGQTVWVTDTSNYRISIWTKSRSTWTHASNFGSYGNGASQFSRVGGVAVSGDEHTAWVSDSGISVWRQGCPKK